MAALKGRALQLKKDGTLVAGVRTKSFSIGNTVIDITNDDDDGIRKALTDFGQREVSITFSGVRVADTMLEAALAADTTDTYSLAEAAWGTLTGTWMLTSYSETGEYQGSVTFEAELASIDEITFTPGA
jgi:TP901-1 family phage major tail protein